MEPRVIGNEERLALLSELEQATTAQRAAAEECRKVFATRKATDEVLRRAEERVSDASAALRAAFPNAPEYWMALPEPKAANPELTQREHEVWITAYNAAHGDAGIAPGATRRSNDTRAGRASAAAREAVEAYRVLTKAVTPTS